MERLSHVAGFPYVAISLFSNHEGAGVSATESGVSVGLQGSCIFLYFVLYFVLYFDPYLWLRGRRRLFSLTSLTIQLT
jgi:hypothetical protein